MPRFCKTDATGELASPAFSAHRMKEAAPGPIGAANISVRGPEISDICVRQVRVGAAVGSSGATPSPQKGDKYVEF
jgi:hypothetical protein